MFKVGRILLGVGTLLLALLALEGFVIASDGATSGGAAAMVAAVIVALLASAAGLHLAPLSSAGKLARSDLRAHKRGLSYAGAAIIAATALLLALRPDLDDAQIDIQSVGIGRVEAWVKRDLNRKYKRAYERAVPDDTLNYRLMSQLECAASDAVHFTCSGRGIATNLLSEQCAPFSVEITSGLLYSVDGASDYNASEPSVTGANYYGCLQAAR